MKCKSISEEKMGINKTRLIFNSKLYYDFTVRGAADTYLSAIEELCSAIKDDYPAISHELWLHKERYKGDETIIHYTAMNAIVDCLLALEKEHTKKIFISHSSKGAAIVKLFADYILQLGIGINADDIFCTSIEEMGIRNGEDIRKHIRENITSADFSFMMISKNYKSSEICLNEMGAVWATNNNVRYFVLPGVDFDEIGWLCNPNKADGLCNPVALDSLEAELTEYYGLPHKGAAWSRMRQEFVEGVGDYKG